MRRGLASLIMGLSLLVATASWAGFIMSRTVLDPGRSERLADTLLDNTEVREAIVGRLADSVESQIPAEIPVTRDLIEQGADNALDDPRVEELFRDGLVRAHQNALNGVDEPIMIDAAALGAAGRDAVVALQPELDAVLPRSPSVEVELPSTGLSWLGAVKAWVDRVTIIGGAIAIIGVATAFVLARNRAAALRRVAFWAFGASAFWLAVAYGLPWALGRLAPSSVSIASAAIDVFFGAMVRPALVMAGFGVVLLLVSLAWPSFTARRPAAMLDRPRRPAPSNRGAPPMAPAPSSTAAQPPRRPPVPAAYQPLDYRESGGRRFDRPAEPNQDPTIQFPQIHSNAAPSAPPTVASPRAATPPPAAANEAATARTHAPATPPAQQQPGRLRPQPQPAPQQPQPGRQQPQPVATPWPQRAVDMADEIDTTIDAEAAADADDFGAEWVEGVGYVDER